MIAQWEKFWRILDDRNIAFSVIMTHVYCILKHKSSSTEHSLEVVKRGDQVNFEFQDVDLGTHLLLTSKA